MRIRNRIMEHGTRSVVSIIVIHVLCSMFHVPGLSAQVPTDALILRGLDFERQSRFEDAANAFRQVLAREPTNPQGLLGAERTYAQIGRRDSIMALTTR